MPPDWWESAPFSFDEREFARCLSLTVKKWEKMRLA